MHTSRPNRLISILGTSWFGILLDGSLPNVKATPELHDALMLDIQPPTSPTCTQKYVETNSMTRFEFNFESLSSDDNQWASVAASVEREEFLVEMATGTPTDDASGEGWKLRIGSGGNIYSFFGKFGEAMAPQDHDNAYFMDEVWQSVAVNTALNKPDSGNAHYIHQSGCYQRDDLTEPYYSPDMPPDYDVDGGALGGDESLTCKENFCAVGGWGQHAHFPTKYESGALYFNRYTDCGGGVMEWSTIIHNAGNDADNEMFNYINSAWMGVRIGTLPELHIAKNGVAEWVKPHPLWGDNANGIVPVSETSGWSMYTQELQSDGYQMPAGVNYEVRACRRADFQSDTVYETEVFLCVVQPTEANSNKENRALNMYDPNVEEDEGLNIKAVLHYAHNGQYLYFYPEDGQTAAQYASKFPAGSTIMLRDKVVNLPIEENVALGLIHGTKASLDEFLWVENLGDNPDPGYRVNAESRLRFGSSALVKRDYHAFTVNPRLNLEPGKTYYKRWYVITGNLTEMGTVAPAWVDETQQGVWQYPDTGEMGQTTQLFLYEGSQTDAFGAGLVSQNCTQEGALDPPVIAVICEGHTTPRDGYKPMFAIECGATYYVGSDRYKFAPQGDYKKPYKCEVNGAILDVRPTYTFLGYFPQGTCAGVEDKKYDPFLCEFDGVTST